MPTLQQARQCVPGAGRAAVCALLTASSTSARFDGHVDRFLHRLAGAISGRVHHDPALATDPGDDGGPICVILAPAGLAFLAAPPRSAAQRLLAPLWLGPGGQ